MNNIEKRLGILIGILRKKKQKAGNPAFKQESFVLSTFESPFEGIKFNHSVCSLATLSRLENGKHHHDYELLDFFLRKLDIHYRIKESVQLQESEYLTKISRYFINESIEKFNELMSEFNSFCVTNTKDALIDLDHQAFIFVINCLTNQPISRRTYDHLFEQLEVFHPIIRNWLISCTFLLKLTHPDFWSIEKPSEVPDLIKLCSVELLLIKAGEHSFHHDSVRKDEMSINSLAYNYLQEIALLDYTDSHPRGFYAKELNLCISLAAQESINEIGSSLLFNGLVYFNGIKDPDVQLAYFTDKISRLLTCEPYPQRITKLIGQRILLLCQHTKTYKPLISIVDLLIEKSNEKKSLLERYD
jgi:hypothetical protein